MTLKNHTPVDFEAIRTSLKTYLQSQEIFRDYNFDGSALSVLLDILSVNTQHNAFYGNMLASEKSLRLAQRRQSVVDLANNVGYVPRSRLSAKVNLSFEVFPSDPGNTDPITIPKGTVFATKVDNSSYNFILENDEFVARGGDGKYSVDNIELHEGKQFSHSETITPGQKFVTIPNAGVDTSRMEISVYQSVSTLTPVVHVPAIEYVGVDGNDNIYYLQEIEKGKYQVYFGDGIIGTEITPGNIVKIEYFVPAGPEANGATLFTLQSSLPGASGVSGISVDTQSYGGVSQESQESIRIRSPKFYQRQNRAVTAKDYKDVVLDVYPGARGVTAWGGEENIPPRFGSVFVSIIPQIGFIFSELQKDNIAQSIKSNFGMLSTQPFIVNPEFIFIVPTVNIDYDSNIDGDSPTAIKSLARNAINDFSANQLSNFELPFRYSKFVPVIDSLANNIQSNITDIEMYIRPRALTDVSDKGGIFFKEAVEKGSVRTNKFGYQTFPNAFLKEDPSNINGDIHVYNGINGNDVKVIDNVGSIDYATGAVAFDFVKIVVGDLILNPSEGLRLYATPVDKNIIPNLNQVVTISDVDIKINVTDTITGTVF